MHKLLKLIKIDFAPSIRRVLHVLLSAGLASRIQNGGTEKNVQTFSSTEEVDMCSSCFCVTRYTCLKCEKPICDKCSIFEANEDTPGWVAGKRVGFCEPCAKDR